MATSDVRRGEIIRRRGRKWSLRGRLPCFAAAAAAAIAVGKGGGREAVCRVAAPLKKGVTKDAGIISVWRKV